MSMIFIARPRLVARVGGAIYLMITACALFAYLYVRGRLIVSGDPALTADNILAHEQLYRIGAAAALVVVVANVPLGLIMYELLKIVSRPLALLALLFIAASAALEAVNVLNYLSPLLVLKTPGYAAAFDPAEVQALAAGPIRVFSPGFGIALAFFGGFCATTGYLIARSSFLPRILGALMILKGAWYLYSSFAGILALGVPDIPLWIHLIPENALALWLLLFGVNEAAWRAQAAALNAAQRFSTGT
jgi:hypothetical protein